MQEYIVYVAMCTVVKGQKSYNLVTGLMSFIEGKTNKLWIGGVQCLISRRAVFPKDFGQE